MLLRNAQSSSSSDGPAQATEPSRSREAEVSVRCPSWMLHRRRDCRYQRFKKLNSSPPCGRSARILHAGRTKWGARWPERRRTRHAQVQCAMFAYQGKTAFAWVESGQPVRDGEIYTSSACRARARRHLTNVERARGAGGCGRPSGTHRRASASSSRSIGPEVRRRCRAPPRAMAVRRGQQDQPLHSRRNHPLLLFDITPVAQTGPPSVMSTPIRR